MMRVLLVAFVSGVRSQSCIDAPEKVKGVSMLQVQQHRHLVTSTATKVHAALADDDDDGDDVQASANVSDVMKITHYWDCNGQGCDATVLQPWDQSKYVASPGYGPQDPNDFGGPSEHGEKLWLTGAASDALATIMGANDPCCGKDNGSPGGCGKCLLIQNPESINPGWKAIIMKKNRCPPWTNGCDAGTPHFDVAAPGFDNLQYSTANVCGKRGGTGFTNQHDSEILGAWWNLGCKSTADCAHLCDKLPAAFRKGCKLFASWGWTKGDPSQVMFQPVDCPVAFVSHIGSLFDKSGVVAGASPPSGNGSPSTQPPIPPTEPPIPATQTPVSTMEPATTSVPPQPTETDCAGGWKQCGGKDWSGAACCQARFECKSQNEWYSQCEPIATDPDADCAGDWQQCGGKDWSGATCCQVGFECKSQNEWYSQCKSIPAMEPPIPVTQPPVPATDPATEPAQLDK